MFGTKCLPVCALAFSMTIAATAGHAVTVTEADVGEFSSNWAAPTVLGDGVTSVSGTGAGNAYDILLLTGLASGAQTLSFSFEGPSGADYSYSAGGSIRYSETPFRWGWDGQDGGSFATTYYDLTDSLEIVLGDAFGGVLYLALYFTHGQDLAYTFSSSASVDAIDPAPVPLPAAGLLLGGALALFGAAAARRRRC
ncbi:hypothetical protein [Psychromarinibacter sp. S121]|uniref:hypothetical protein n=1 Tax=Psychromarinibacter sp. S121 TaxID=3415127 RepID=UPI003C7C3C82